MGSFFFETSKARLYQNKAKYPLLKLKELLDWSAIGDSLQRARREHRKDARGSVGYARLKMFQAVLLGQWHSLSAPELEHALAIRADFLVFCEFDDMELPDHTTLCRYRQWLMKHDLLIELLNQINRQLQSQGLKLNKAQVAVVDASSIKSRGMPRKKALEVNDGQVSESAASKDAPRVIDDAFNVSFSWLLEKYQCKILNN